MTINWCKSAHVIVSATFEFDLIWHHLAINLFPTTKGECSKKSEYIDHNKITDSCCHTFTIHNFRLIGLGRVIYSTTHKFFCLNDNYLTSIKSLNLNACVIRYLEYKLFMGMIKRTNDLCPERTYFISGQELSDIRWSKTVFGYGFMRLQ